MVHIKSALPCALGMGTHPSAEIWPFRQKTARRGRKTIRGVN